MIPDYWSPREALAVYDFIDNIRDAIWNRYELELIKIMQAEHSTARIRLTGQMRPVKILMTGLVSRKDAAGC
jgi:hypothetical protein